MPDKRTPVVETVVGNACAQDDEQQMLAGRVAEVVRTEGEQGMEMVTRVTKFKFESYLRRQSASGLCK